MMKGENSGNELISRKPPKDNAVEHSSHEKENDFIIYDTFETNFDLNVFVWELFLHLTHLVTVFNPLTHVVDSKLPLVSATLPQLFRVILSLIEDCDVQQRNAVCLTYIFR